MLQKIKTLILSLSLLFVPASPILVVGTASAQDIQENVCQGANTIGIDPVTGGSCTISADTCDLTCIIRKVVNIISIIVGVIAVVMIIVGGFRYVASGGKAESVQGAKNTIMYAIIGLIIVALAQVVVRYVLKSTLVTGP